MIQGRTRKKGMILALLTAFLIGISAMVLPSFAVPYSSVTTSSDERINTMIKNAKMTLGSGYSLHGYNWTGVPSTSTITCSGLVDIALCTNVNGNDQFDPNGSFEESSVWAPEGYYSITGTPHGMVEEFEVGDLVYYEYDGRKPGHVAIYLGNGKVIHANGYSTGVCISAWDYDNDCMGAGPLPSSMLDTVYDWSTKYDLGDFIRGGDTKSNITEVWGRKGDEYTQLNVKNGATTTVYENSEKGTYVYDTGLDKETEYQMGDYVSEVTGYALSGTYGTATKNDNSVTSTALSKIYYSTDGVAMTDGVDPAPAVSSTSYDEVILVESGKTIDDYKTSENTNTENGNTNANENETGNESTENSNTDTNENSENASNANENTGSNENKETEGTNENTSNTTNQNTVNENSSETNQSSNTNQGGTNQSSVPGNRNTSTTNQNTAPMNTQNDNQNRSTTNSNTTGNRNTNASKPDTNAETPTNTANRSTSNTNGTSTTDGDSTVTNSGTGTKTETNTSGGSSSTQTTGSPSDDESTGESIGTETTNASSNVTSTNDSTQTDAIPQTGDGMLMLIVTLLGALVGGSLIGRRR